MTKIDNVLTPTSSSEPMTEIETPLELMASRSVTPSKDPDSKMAENSYPLEDEIDLEGITLESPLDSVDTRSCMLINNSNSTKPDRQCPFEVLVNLEEVDLGSEKPLTRKMIIECNISYPVSRKLCISLFPFLNTWWQFNLTDELTVSSRKEPPKQ